MPAKDTVVLFVHGANQAQKNQEKNSNTWLESFNVTNHAKAVLNTVTGGDNQDIQTYHKRNHNGRDYPQYVDWTAPWYGDVWASLSNQENPFDRRLNESDEANDDRISILQKVERHQMKKHFDELVPFYELAVIKSDGRTLYEAICHTFIEQLIAATQNGQHYVLVGHSMGCAVTYNVMSHISCAQNGTEYCAIDGALSDEYRQAVSTFSEGPSKCFGLLTFGNYTGYDWCQRLNNRILYGELKKQYVYPGAVGRWFNFWTVAGGDPYILDDQLDDDFVDNEDKFEDIAVKRIFGFKIGHGRAKWFRRKQFAKRLRNKMVHHLYL